MPEPRTTWRDIADDLRTAITAGQYAPGARLPSRAKLMERYGVAPQTVVNAIGALRNEGLVLGVTGSGWYVRAQRPVMRATRSRLSRSERAEGRGAFTTDAHSGGWTARSEAEVRVEAADDEVSGYLAIDPGAPVLVRDRVMFADDEPVQLAVSYLPREVTEGTAIEDDNPGPGGIYARLEDGGHALTRFEEAVRIGRASEHEAHQLSLSPGDPVFRLTRVASTAERPVEVNRIVLSGERFELYYDLPSE